MASQAVVDFLNGFDVEKLKALKKADLLQVAIDLKIHQVKKSMRVGMIRKLIAEYLVEEGHYDEEILEEFPERQKSEIEMRLELARLEIAQRDKEI